jgi:tetratricopeptide (TPR) repeat protein
VFAQLNTDKILTIGRNALYFEDYVLSIQYFNQVIKVKPYLSEPYMYRCIAKIQLGDYEGAETDGTEAINRNPFTPQAFYARGFARMKLEKFTDAYNDFSKALEFSPNSQHLLVSRMDASDRSGNHQEALQDAETLIRLFPKVSGFYYERGRIFLSLKDTISSEKSFNQFIAADSTNPAGWSARGLLKLQQNKKNEAYQDYSKAINLKSAYFGDYLNRGIINVDLKRYMEALNDYEYAIKLEPKNIAGWMNRGILRSTLGDNNNALTDFKEVIKMDSSNMEARYSKAMLEMKLRDYRTAIHDYKIIIEKHPFFIPAYWGISEAYNNMNNVREAFKYRQKAIDIENNKDDIRKKMKQNLDAKAKIAQDIPSGNTRKKTEMFNRFATQESEDAYETEYQDDKRGAIQKKFVDVINEKNFVLSYYSKVDALRQTNLFHPLIDAYNKSGKLQAGLKITCEEIPLTSELINRHFENINNISAQLSNQMADADILFKRAVEFAMVQDFTSAVEDLNKAILLKSDFALAYFMRANIRYKFIDYMRNAVNQENNSDKSVEKIYAETEYKFDVEMVMRDFEKVNELIPDFAFSFYNKANILCVRQDYKSAIENYTKAILIDSDFAEAYYNRGLTFLFIGNDSKGLADLSKAGELGIYSAYNLIQRFK